MRILLYSACTLLMLAPTAWAVERTIRVTGEGKAAAVPDMATIQAGVTSRGPTATDTLSANNKAMTTVLATLKEQGVAAKDVQTSSLNIHPVHRMDPQGRMLNEIIAYEVSNQVHVKVRDIAKLGGTLDAVVRSGANQMSGVSFGFSDSTELTDKARKGAIDDAKRRAKLYAEQAGVKLGKVLNISEQPMQREPQFRGGAMLARAMDSEVPVAAGEEEVRAQVFVEFQLED